MADRAPTGIESYRRTEIESRTPLELVVMLYDGALRFLREARAAIERRDVRARRDAVARALAILSELQSTLDMEAGGDTARTLDQIYSYVTTRVTDASFAQKVEPLDEAIRILLPLRDAWATISAQPAPGATPAAQ
jgi:flagellar protein FliS